VRTRIAIGASLLALIAGMAIVLAESRPERTGVNGIAPDAYVASLRPGQSICQPATVPAGTRSVGLTVGVYGLPGPPLALIFTGSAGAQHGRSGGGYPSGELSVPLPPARHRGSGALCLRNAGRSPVALAGVPAVGPVSTIDGKPSRAALELEYLRGSASGFALGTTVARRVGLLHGGDWLLWVLVALMAGTAATAIGLALREIRE
jgi:hypothetical protein